MDQLLFLWQWQTLHVIARAETIPINTECWMTDYVGEMPNLVAIGSKGASPCVGEIDTFLVLSFYFALYLLPLISLIRLQTSIRKGFWRNMKARKTWFGTRMCFLFNRVHTLKKWPSRDNQYTADSHSRKNRVMTIARHVIGQWVVISWCV